DQADSRRAILEICDSGPGVSKEVAERLFEPFVTGKPEGVGLGLAVARQVAEAHGGCITWERRGDCTCFRVEMPLDHRGQRTADSQQKTEAPHQRVDCRLSVFCSLSSVLWMRGAVVKHILIVDDEEAVCWSLQRALSREGHSVAVAASAEQAFALMKDQPPDAVLLDVRLPGMDGLTALSRMKQMGLEAPVIIATAFGNLPTAVRAV